jgi:predicted membrane-bound mannosyltransferase
VLTGFFTGMMYATKETCLVIFAALIGALLLTRFTLRGWRPQLALKRYHLLAAFGAALFIAVLFYSSFFKNPAGPVDSVLAFKTYFLRAGDPGFHIHPWYYYLKMLAFSKYGSGPAWSEGLVLILALIGSIVSFREKVTAGISRVFLRFIFFYTLLATVIFSLIPYKTPWNMLPFYAGMIILAGAGALSVLDWFKNRAAAGGEPQDFKKGHVLRVGVRLLLLTAVVNLTMQSVRANFKYYADNRNPYVYAHTVNDFKRLVQRIVEIAALHPDRYDMRINVITNPYDTWPLPWYLRTFRRVGYWQDAAAAGPLSDVPVIAASLDKDEGIEPVLRNGFQAEYYGLRPEVLLVIYVRQDLWQAFMNTRTR